MEFRGLQDPSKILILKRDHQTGKWEDQTHKIIYLNDSGQTFYVVYKSGGGNSRPYHISFYDMKVFKAEDEINSFENGVNADGIYYSNILKIIRFGSFYKLFLNHNTIIARNIKKVESNNSDNKQAINIFNYYKDLAAYAAGITEEELSVEKLLNNLYLKNNNIRPYSVLMDYLGGISRRTDNPDPFYIYPFGTNLSQQKAVESAFSNSISIVEGPPGTGKTQTILNIIANAVIRMQNIAVISNNNTAVENVQEKLDEEGLSVISAFLGNATNVNAFFEKDNQKQMDAFLNDFHYDSINLTEKINDEHAEINKVLEFKNDIAALYHNIDELKTEFDHFKKTIDLAMFSQYDKFRIPVVYQKLLDLKNELMHRPKKGWLFRCSFLLKYGIKYNFIKEQMNSFLDFLEFSYYTKKLKAFEHELKEKQHYISSHDYDELLKKYRHDSVVYIKRFLYYKYKNYQTEEFTVTNYKNHFRKFINRFPLLLSTTHSLLRNTNDAFMFDLIVIDEASQSNILSSLLTMNITKRIVVVGDSKQLPQIDNQDIYDYSEQLVNKYNIPKSYQYKENSILNSVHESVNNVPVTLLKEHYRCDSRIINFCNKKFYDEELIIMTRTSETDPLVVIRTVPGNHARKNPYGTGLYNDRETEEIKMIIEKEQSNNIGVITPFRYQAEIIREKLQDHPSVEVDTIHKYQGRQKEIVILSTVVNDIDVSEETGDFISNFITNSKLLNVAISRAVKKLYIVVSEKVFQSRGNNIAELLQYIRYNCSQNSFQDGKVISIFDILYQDNFKSLMVKRKLMNRISDFDSENIAYDMLQGIMKDFPMLKVTTHVRLKTLLLDVSNFNQEQQNYLNHYMSHVDFVLYNKVTHIPILAIEVDGVRFHEQNEKQNYHDQIKAKALAENGIPLIRLKTNGNGEKEKIIEELTKIYIN